jgi:acyl carrier protein
MDDLLQELKVKIIEILNLPDVRPDDIGEDDLLVGGPLGIDSIDVLEMVIMLEKDYGVVIGDRELGAKVFATLRTLADYVHTQTREIAN